MRFITPTAKRYTVVVRPAGRIIINGIPQPVPGLRAKFRNGIFDSVRAQEEAGWTDEERKQVEAKLLAHSAFQRQHGFYLERIDGEGLPSEVTTISTTRCIAFIRNERDEAEQCGRDAEAGTDYCHDHRIEVDVEADAAQAEMDAAAETADTVLVAAGD